MSNAQTNDRTPEDAVRTEPRWLVLIAKASSTLNKCAAALAALLLVLMTAHILFEIVLRFFSQSTFMVNTLVAYGVAATTFLAMPWALEQGSMIRVSVITQTLAPRLRWVTEIFAVVVTALLVALLATYQWESVFQLFERGRTSSDIIPIPLWIPEAIFLVGLCLIFIQLCVRFLRLMTIGLTGDSELVI